MRAVPLPARLNLEHRELFDAGDASGVDFTCREGTVWLTLDGDLRDVVLGAGDSFHTGEHRRALIYALEPARVDLVTRKGREPITPARAPTDAGQSPRALKPHGRGRLHPPPACAKASRSNTLSS